MHRRGSTRPIHTIKNLLICAGKVHDLIPRAIYNVSVAAHARMRTRICAHMRASHGPFFLAVLSLLVVGFNIVLEHPLLATAATNNTINFQSRLETSTGAVVADGNYNVEFKLYSASSGGSALWTEDYQNNASHGVQVINGYLTVSLGSITTFPTNINWDQQLWLTMNIGGTTTGSPTWDGEMNPRLQLTAVPYSFRAGTLADPANSGATLSWATQGAANNLLLPNENGTLCSTGSVCSGYAPSTLGTGYIQNGTSPQSGANFNIGGNGTIGGTLAITGASTTAVQVQSSGTNLLLVDTSGNNVNLGVTGSAAVASTVNIATTTGNAQQSVNIGSSGNTSNSVTIDAGSNSSSIQIGNSNNSHGIQIGTGTSGVQTIALGSTNSTSTTTIQAGVNGTTPTLSLQAAASGYIAIGTTNANTIQIGAVGSTSNASTVTIANSTGAGQSVVIGSTNSSSTLTIQGGATSQTLNNTGDTVSISNSTSAFQVSNGTNNVFSVSTNSTTPQAVLGTNTNLAGSLLFNTTSSGNPITLKATSDSTSGGYTLSLPTSAPAAGLCLQTSSSYIPSTGQLVFSSCTNSNASIAEVAYNDAHGSSSTVSSVTDTTQNVGDLIVLTAQTPSGTAISSISGGNATNWTRVGFLAGDGTVNRVEMWMGTVTSVGSGTISLSPGGSFGNNNEITETEYTASGVNAGSTWGVDTQGTNKSSGSSTVTFPSLTPQAQGELYEGFAQVQNTPATAGSSTGFTYKITGQSNVIAYDTYVNPVTSFSPTATQNSSGEANTIGAIFTAYVSSTAVNNATSVQLANFNVQAATSGTVAGILQASTGDSTDNILNFYGDTAGQTSANQVLGINYLGNLQFGGLSAQTTSVAGQTTANTAGANLSISAATGNGTGAGGVLSLTGGNAGATSGANGGNVLIEGGSGTGTGSSGSVIIQSNSSNSTAAFEVQNAAGLIALQVDTLNDNVIVGTSSTHIGVGLSSWVTNNYAIGCTTAGCGSPSPRFYAASVAANGFVYEIGGSSVSNGSTAGCIISSNTDATNTVYFASLNSSGGTGSWATTTVIPTALCGESAVVANGYIYVFGGINTSSVDQSATYSALICTGSNSGTGGCGSTAGTIGTWTTLSGGSSPYNTPIPVASDGAGAAVANGYVYLAAGETSRNGTDSNSLFYALICTGSNSGTGGCTSTPGTLGTWTTSTINTGEEWATATAYNGYLYVIGGWNSGLTTTVQYALLNPSTGAVSGSWQTGTSLLTPIAEATSFASNGYLYVMGGTTVTNSTSTNATSYVPISSIDGSLGSWTSTAPLLATLSSATSILYNGYAYVLGGQTNAGSGPAVSTVYYSPLNPAPTGFIAKGQFQNNTDSATAFLIQNAATTSTLFAADTLNSTVSLTSASTTAALLKITNNSATSNDVVDIVANSLTSGTEFSISSTSSGITSTGSLFSLIANSASTPTSGLFQIQANALTSGVAFNINKTGNTLNGGSLMQIQANSEQTPASGIAQFSATALKTGSLVNISSNNGTSLTTGQLLVVTGNSEAAPSTGLVVVQANALTTGKAFSVTSTGAGITSGSLLNISSATTGLVATNGIVSLQATGAYTSTSNVGLLSVQANSTQSGTVANFSGTSVNTGTVLQVTAGNTTVTTGNTLAVTGGRSTFTPTQTVASAAGAVWDGINVPATTATVTGSTNITTANGFNEVSLYQPTITDVSAVTISNAATLFVAGAPTTTGSVTITNSAGIWNNGFTRTGLVANGGAAAVCSSLGTGNTPTNGTSYLLEDCSSAPSADYAENYPVVSGANYGDVVSEGSQMVDTYASTPDGNTDWTTVKGQITQLVKATTPYQANVIGIVSDNHSNFTSAGYNIKQEDNPMPVALNGRVPVNVTTENGPIEPGDYLTPSATVPGYAMKATQAGYVIGQALAAYTDVNPGQVMVFVKNMYYPGPTTGQTLQSGSVVNLTASGLISTNDLQVSGSAVIQSLLASSANIENLSVTGGATIQELSVLDNITSQTLNIAGTANVLTLQVNGQVNLGATGEDPTQALPHPITVLFKASKPISAGAVLIADSVEGYVTTTNNNGDTRVVGVAVTSASNPGDTVEVAIGGTARVLVNGSASIAQLLDTSNIEGEAGQVDNPKPGQVVGKVLSTSDQNGEVLLLISLE